MARCYNLRPLFQAGVLKPKVFCVGFHKTGTKSLARALEILGYRVTGPNGARDPRIAERALPMALDIASRFDAFNDNPWSVLFRELDAAFPGSRFILTLRAPDSWIDSVVRHFGDERTPMREWIYGAGPDRRAATSAPISTGTKVTTPMSSRISPAGSVCSPWTSPPAMAGRALRLPRTARSGAALPARQSRRRNGLGGQGSGAAAVRKSAM